MNVFTVTFDQFNVSLLNKRSEIRDLAVPNNFLNNNII